MMSTYPLQSVRAPCNRSRIGSLSIAIAVNLFAILLLARPGETPAPATKAVAIGIRSIEPPPPPIALPLPPEPVPRALAPRRPGPAPVAPVIDAPATPQSLPDSPTSPEPESVMPDTTAASTIPANGDRRHARLEYTHVVTPRYPRDALRRGEHGIVLLRVQVGADGVPKQIGIARSSGSSQLDRAAIEALRQWRFRPMQVDGVDVPATGLVPVAFNLERG